MLDGKGGGAGAGDSFGEYDQSERSFGAASGGKRAMNGPKEKFSADLDDEIPF